MSKQQKQRLKKTTSFSIASALIISMIIAIVSLLNISLFPPKTNIEEVKAAGEISIYRSVGPSATSVLEVGTANNLTISGSVAIFASDLGTDIGVGDALQYDSDNNGSIDAIVFIHGRTDATHYTVRTVAGGTVADLATADNNWSIFRAYISLANAENGIENTGIDDAVENFDTWTGGKDISSAGSNEQWNIACYANGTTADTARVTVDGWTTDVDSYIRIYTPVLSSEVGVSQRHDGKWNTGKYKIEASGHWASILKIQEPYTQIKGLQVAKTTGDSSNAIIYLDFNNSGSAYSQVSHTIVKMIGGSIAVGIQFRATNPKIYNNIVYDCNIGIKSWYSTDARIYNNTVQNCSTGFVNDQYTGYFKNNLSKSTIDFVQTNGTLNANYNVSADGTADDFGGSGNKANQIFVFVDEANDDFHLAISDAAARNAGTDLSADAGLSFSDDIDGQTRSNPWDIGADEIMESDVTPPVISNGSPAEILARATTNTALSVTTDETATCRYSINAGIVYDNMTDEFTSINGITHTATVSVVAGNNYAYYVRCQDDSFNPNISDYEISFRVTDGTSLTCSTADIQTEINLALDNETVFVPAGTCAWTSTLVLDLNSTPKSLTIQGAGAGQTIIEDNVTTTNLPILRVITADGKSFRLTGFTFKNGTSTSIHYSGAVSISGYSKAIRVDHNTFKDLRTLGIYLNGYLYGVLDNNTFDVPGKLGVQLYHSNWGGSLYTYGDGSWAEPLYLGTNKAIYMEDNDFLSGLNASDSIRGARFVFRYNTVTNFAGVVTHGTESSGRQRSTRSYEIYNNIFDRTGFSSVDRAIILRGGTGTIFNNTVLNYSNLGNGQNFRSADPFSPWGTCDGTSVYDNNDGVTYDFGTHTGGTVVNGILTSEGKNWTTNEWIGYSLRNITEGWSAMISSNIANTMSVVDTIFGHSRTWNNGDNFEILRAYPCLDQVGRGTGDLLSESSPLPESWPNQAQEPVYIWNNTLNESTANLSGGHSNIQANRDFYNETADFNGTAGVGIGILSDRPINCTIGVGYWGTDTNTLYKCTSTSTWELYYTPYTYPHPLRDTGASPTFTINSGVETGPVSSDTINITAEDETGLNSDSLEYGFSADNICDSSDTYGNSFTNSTDFTISTNQTNYLCVKAEDGAGNIGYQLVGQLNIETSAPTRSNGLPTGALDSGTTSATLSITTNENATCKYSTTANTTYSAMTNTFTTTGNTSHSQNITGLTNGNSYNYYVRCIDVALNENTADYTISFSVDTATSGGGAISPNPPTIPNQPFTITTINNQNTINLTNTENIYQIAISTTPDFKHVSWEPYQENIVLPDAEIVYLKFRSPTGGVSEVYEIEVDAMEIETETNFPEGSLIKAINDFKVYIISNPSINSGQAYIRHIIDEIIFSFYNHLNKSDIKEVDSSQLNNHQESFLIRELNDHKVYEIKDNKKYWLDLTEEEFINLGYKWDEVYIVNEEELEWYL